LTKLKSQSQKHFNEQKYQYILFEIKEQESVRTGHVKIIGYQFGTKLKLVVCAKYNRGLDLGFWEILKPLKWTNITSFFLIKTND
jgi:hypothetical protein